MSKRNNKGRNRKWRHLDPSTISEKKRRKKQKQKACGLWGHIENEFHRPHMISEEERKRREKQSIEAKRRNKEKRLREERLIRESYTNAWLYLVKFQSESETFYKVGVTKNAFMEDRFSTDEYDGYTINTIRKSEMNRDDAINIEQDILARHRKFRYYPRRRFSGHTECFICNEETRKIFEP